MQPLSELTVFGFGFRPAIRTIVASAMRAFYVKDVLFFDEQDELMSALSMYDPDMLFMETNSLPNDPASDILRRIRYLPDAPNPYLPMIAVSPHKTKGDVMQAIGLGYHEYLTIPLSAQRLWRALTHTAFVGRPFVETPNYFGPCRRRRNDIFFDCEERRSKNDEGLRMEQERRMDEIAMEWQKTG